ncbi:hypothetical protein Enr13x_09350 [Stieleria neptunia]|uniref:Uncharacterized protein n=1 Tax=Stieleria neptunia TaxID=2527979 RepID=A0A518HJR7_9BACT|nr:hypothetical protein [Stieleria neptunia]QDV41097.1 hypothetical protein Enr13x_09350 [Stieleria neptunia]
MGAQLFFHTSAYTSDPNVALESLQATELDGYDLPEMVASNLASSQRAFDDTPEGDEYGLHDHYKAELERAKLIASEPIPTDFRGRLHLVRRLHADTGQGIGNILDVEGIAGNDGAGWSAAKPLAPVGVIAKFGSGKLLSSKAHEYAGIANEWLGRGECICFPLYANTDEDDPVEWCFVGNTVD